MEREINVLVTDDGHSPFEKWLHGLRDKAARARILSRLDRLELGGFGDVKRIGPISELRIDYGPGYRIYFAEHNLTVVVLLIGGDKSSQQQDINVAVRLWDEYKDGIEKYLRNLQR